MVADYTEDMMKSRPYPGQPRLAVTGCDIEADRSYYVWDIGSLDEAVSLYRCGVAYWIGNDTTPSPSAAITYIRQAANLGLIEAKLYMFILRQVGLENQTSDEELKPLLEKASCLGLARPQAYKDESGVDERIGDIDGKLLKCYLAKIAASGSLEAKLYLSLCYQKGIGVEQDRKAAFDLCLASARGGCVAAKYELGIHYAHGDGIDADIHTAVQWWNEASNAAYAPAQYALGMTYLFNANLGEHSTENGIELLRKAAMSGNKSATAILGFYAALDTLKGGQNDEP